MVIPNFTRDLNSGVACARVHGTSGSLASGAGISGGSLGHQDRVWQPVPVPPPQTGAGQPGGTRGSPSPGHRAATWGWGWAEVWLGCGPMNGVRIRPHEVTQRLGLSHAPGAEQ